MHSVVHYNPNHRQNIEVAQKYIVVNVIWAVGKRGRESESEGVTDGRATREVEMCAGCGMHVQDVIVLVSAVIGETREPLGGRFLPSILSAIRSAEEPSGVRELRSAVGMALRFVRVSKVCGPLAFYAASERASPSAS